MEQIRLAITVHNANVGWDVALSPTLPTFLTDAKHSGPWGHDSPMLITISRWWVDRSR